MKKKSETILFFGNERLATAVSTTAPVLRALTSAGYTIEAVIANHQDPVSHQKRDLEIGKVAHELGIPVILPGHNIPLIDKVKQHRASIAVLVAFGKIIPQTVIDLFPKGIINIHPSLLPKHRGPTPVESVILQGESNTGVSIMRLSKAMDAGPIFAQSEIKLNGNETKQGLADQLGTIGAAMLLELLPDIIAGSVVALPQDDSMATYDQLIHKENGVIDWQKPALQIEREIRAYAGWPGSRTTFAGKEVIITQAHPSPHDNGISGALEVTKNVLKVTCGQDCLIIDKLKPAGKPEMTAAAFLAGYRHLLI